MTTTRFLASVGTPIALVAFLAGLQHPGLFLWFGGIALVLGGLGGYAAAYVFRGERDEAELQVERLEAECNEHAATNARLTAEARLTDPATATTVHVPLLHLVDPRETEWPAIMRVVEGEVSP